MSRISPDWMGAASEERAPSTGMATRSLALAAIVGAQVEKRAVCFTTARAQMVAWEGGWLVWTHFRRGAVAMAAVAQSEGVSRTAHRLILML